MSWLDPLRLIYGTDTDGLTNAVAARLYEAHNRSKGAAFPGGYGFLSAADREPWKRRAHNVLAVPMCGDCDAPADPNCRDPRCPMRRAA